MSRAPALLLAALTLFVTACGGGDKKTNPSDTDPVRNVPSENGVREQIQSAATPDSTEFPPSKGKTLQQLADGMVSGPSLAMASSIFTTPGKSRMAFGMIGGDGSPVYGPTAIYVA